MNLHLTRTQIITAAAVLLLLGGFTTAFAYPAHASSSGGTATTSTSSTVQPTASTSTSTSASTSTKSTSTTSVSLTGSVSKTATTTSIAVITCGPTAATCIPICRNYFDLQLNPVPIPSGLSSYRYGVGHVILSIQGDAIYMTATINNAMPLTEYDITLNINGANHLLATMVTNQRGDGEVTAQILLQNGVYSISAQVFDMTNFSSQTLVLQSVSVTVTLPQPGPTPLMCGPVPVSVNVGK